jgi:histidinol-phosphate/aromatic aminotransferase/cobyric acid decarboxylase-like protein
MTLPLQPELVGRPYAPAECVVEHEQLDLAHQVLQSTALNDLGNSVVDDYCAQYRDWILSSRLNIVAGLDTLPVTAFSQGTTEAFDNFYIRHHTRRFRVFRGEYIYHKRIWQRHYEDQWAFIENDHIRPTDAVIVSWPFADTGNTHNQFNQEFLDDCYQLGVPVLIDAAFFGVCANQHYDFSHPAIEEVVFSLSKSFPVNALRIGIRFARKDFEDGMQIYHSTQYVNKLSAAVGTKLMAARDPDTTVTKWRAKQIEFCNQFDLEPSDTVLFGIDTKHKYDHYNRGSVHTNRLCFSRYYETGNLVADE